MFLLLQETQQNYSPGISLEINLGRETRGAGRSGRSRERAGEGRAGAGGMRMGFAVNDWSKSTCRGMRMDFGVKGWSRSTGRGGEGGFWG